MKGRRGRRWGRRSKYSIGRKGGDAKMQWKRRWKNIGINVEMGRMKERERER